MRPLQQFAEGFLTEEAAILDHLLFTKLQDYAPEEATGEDKVEILVQSETGTLGGSYLRWINIKYRNCPLGTILNKATGFCYWSAGDSTYNASDQTIKKPGLTWIGYHNDTDSKIGNGFIKFSYCPQLYCDYNVTSINISETFDPDQQCRGNRHGILCGACKMPFSSAISSTKCVRCSDHSIAYRLLLVLGPLVVAVLVLLFMLWCNVTITDGTINGFLFYTIVYFMLVRNCFYILCNGLPTYPAWWLGSTCI